ncbi:hypothetical protein ACFWDA_22555 [Rhodococcus zopfii]|uniref:hypothetical protein n=1 Tax=Rhodococcus zopfii TaxID=43772 RepID=UPI000932BB5A|nr:hypothetical protein [Rhodococcus zopfii]
MQILTPAARPGFHVRPTLPKQCWGFVVGSACFAIGSAPGLTGILGPSANVVFFVGSWFFTAAALIQLLLSGPMTTEVDGAQLIRAEWLSAAVQFFGTLLFNVSTGAALRAHTIAAEKHFVWNPDAAGSVAFLLSGVLAVVAYSHVARMWEPRARDWWAVWVNMAGSVAFGISAVGAYITPAGTAESDFWSNAGTFVGALCFLVAALLPLPLGSTANPAPAGSVTAEPNR